MADIFQKYMDKEPTDQQVDDASELVKAVMQKFGVYDDFINTGNVSLDDWDEVVHKIAEIAVMCKEMVTVLQVCRSIGQNVPLSQLTG